MTCKNSAATGCACPEHATGLMAYAKDPVAYEAALAKIRGSLDHRQAPQVRALRCESDPMVCNCPVHREERVERIHAEPRMIPQPWMPRASRHARAA